MNLSWNILEVRFKHPHMISIHIDIFMFLSIHPQTYFGGKTTLNNILMTLSLKNKTRATLYLPSIHYILSRIYVIEISPGHTRSTPPRRILRIIRKAKNK